MKTKIGMSTLTLSMRSKMGFLSKSLFKFIFVGAFVLVSGVFAFARQTNPDCPNGCLTTPGHCWCYQYYPYKEAIGEAQFQ